MQVQSIYEQTSANRIPRTIVDFKEEKVEDVGSGQVDEIFDNESFKCEPAFSDDSDEGSVDASISGN